MDKSRQKAIKKAVIPAVLLPLSYIAFLYYKRFVSHRIMLCEVRCFLGIYCPGCGGTHCLTALSHGDILTALHYNAAICLGIAIFLLWWIQNIAAAFGRKIKLIPDNRIFPYTITGIIIAYLVLRNFIPAIAPL